MASYGHANELQRTQPPLSRLEYLVRQLGVWADLNPSLRSLHSEFETISRELREAGAGDIPAEIQPEDTRQSLTAQLSAHRRECRTCRDRLDTAGRDRGHCPRADALVGRLQELAALGR